MKRIAISILKNFFLCNVFSIELEEVVFDETLLQRFLHRTRRGPFFDETYRDFDPKELLSLQRFSKELEEVVFDETYRFCNDFCIELEEAVF